MARQVSLCSDCGRSFTDKHRFYMHRKNSHGEKVQLDYWYIGFLTVLFQAVCKHCSKQFTTQRSLKEHVDSAHNGNTFTCGDCGSVIQTYVNFIRHRKTHSSDEEVLGCFTCHKSFSRKDSLKRHVRTCGTPKAPITETRSKAKIDKIVINELFHVPHVINIFLEKRI